MSGLFASAKPYRIKAAHRRRRKCALGRFVQRYYDPQIGRFLSVDPVTADGNTGANFNRYKYANNNPYRFTDPDGRQAIDEIDEVDPEGTTRGSFKNDLARINPPLSPLPAEPAAESTPSLVPNPLEEIRESGKSAGRQLNETLRGNSGITRSSLNRVKSLVRGLSRPEAKSNPIGQVKVGKLEQIVEKAGGTVRNDGASGVKGSSAGTPHVQTEGLGPKTDSRHVWTEPDVKLKDK